MNRNLMTLCLIVKNESKYLAKCVASAADIDKATTELDSADLDANLEAELNAELDF